MKKRYKIIATAAVLLFFLGAGAYHLIFGRTEVLNVGEGVFQIYNTSVLGRIGANITVIETERGIVVVDTHLSQLASGALSTIAKQSQKPIIVAVITHWHPDHSGGIAAFTEDADIVAHKNVKDILASDHKGFGLTEPGSVHEFEARPKAALPEVLLGDDEHTLAQYGINLKIIHYPNAHTNGDLVVIAPQQKIAILGDLIWPQAFPYIDVHNGGTVRGVLEALKKLLQRTDRNYQFLIGHGPPLSYQHVESHIEMLASTIAFVSAEKADGRLLADIQQTGLPREWQSWESELVPGSQWIEMIYQTL